MINQFIWFNTDHKNSSWQITKEFYEAYGTRTDPKDFMRLPTTYKEITSTITALAKGVDTKEGKIKLSNSPVGHPEEYRVNEQVKRRLRTLGKLSSKLGLEGKSLYTFYTQVVTNFKGVSEFLLTTQNSGFDTARTPEGLFPPSIKNDFQFILNITKIPFLNHGKFNRYRKSNRNLLPSHHYNRCSKSNSNCL